MSVSEFEFINFRRFSHYSSFLPLIIYLPFGCLLGILRLFIFLHAVLLNHVLPDKFPLKRFFLKVMFFVAGIPISVHGSPNVDSKKILVGNSVTNLDPFILSFLWPNTLVVEDTRASKKTVLPHHINVPGEENHEQIVLVMKEKVKDSTFPLLFFPERMKTNGKQSLLKFQHLAFEMDSPIQPITIQTSRFLFDVSVSTLHSSLVEDMFWCLVLPMTLFTVKYLPLTERKRDESSLQFAVRVHANMAKSLGIGTSTFSHHDVMEYIKRRAADESSVQPIPRQSSTKHNDVAEVEQYSKQTNLKSTDPELDLMLSRVQAVFADIPPHCILADLTTTRDVDTTITNILEGRVNTSAPLEQQTIQTTPQSEFSFKAKSFERRAADRQLSFAERKHAMIEAARLKYKQKHGLL